MLLVCCLRLQVVHPDITQSSAAVLYNGTDRPHPSQVKCPDVLPAGRWPSSQAAPR